MQSPLNEAAVILIPAYRPNHALTELVEALAGTVAPAIVVVDDGSGPDFAGVFDAVSLLPNVTVLGHALNLGKGAALKTGMNFILVTHPGAKGIVTVDADGQHAPSDIRNVCARFEGSPGSLVLGVRTFRGQVPLRSRVGNGITRIAMRVLLGHNLIDTQTGLRAVPRSLAARLLKVTASGYDFELEMLIAARHLAISIVQQPIQTIYEPGNPTSHFQPLRDSMRIYFVLLRFSCISLLTAALDNLVFYSLFHLTGTIWQSQALARITAGTFNYTAVRKAAFLSNERHRVVLPRYVLLVVVNGIIAYAGIRFLTSVFPVGVFSAKLMIESFLFIANFAIQRDFVFTRRAVRKA